MYCIHTCFSDRSRTSVVSGRTMFVRYALHAPKTVALLFYNTATVHVYVHVYGVYTVAVCPSLPSKLSSPVG